MQTGKQASDYRVENTDKRDKCPTCNGTGWVDKPTPELSSEYPKRIKHPLGHDVVVNSSEEEAAHLAHPAKDEDDAPETLAVPSVLAAPPADAARMTPLPLSAPYPEAAEAPPVYVPPIAVDPAPLPAPEAPALPPYVPPVVVDPAPLPAPVSPVAPPAEEETR